MGLERKPRVWPQAHIWSDITHPNSLLNRNCATLWTLITRIRILIVATQDSDTKTLWSLLLMYYLQLDNTISMIHGSTYATKSSPYSKHAPISMWIVMNSRGYLNAAISTIKRHRFGRLQGNHNIQIMQLCRSQISVPTMIPQAGINTPPSPSRRRLAFDYCINLRDCNHYIILQNSL